MAAQVLGLGLLPSPVIVSRRRHCKLLASATLSSNCSKTIKSVSGKDLKLSWDSLQQTLRCNARFSCLFSDNRKQDEARKALESAIGGKNTEFEKWDKELKRKEEAGRGGNSGGGGGWFGWFGGSNDDHFWHESQQICFTLLGIIALYLIFAKGDVLLAILINPLLFLLRGTRNCFDFLTSLINRKTSPSTNVNAVSNAPESVTARGNVVRKWGSE